MTESSLPVAVSPRTHEELGGQLSPNVQLVRVPFFNGPGGEDAGHLYDTIQVAWRRQWDRTAWVTDALNLLPGLRWIHTDTAGVDRMPLVRLTQMHVTLTNARGAHTPAVAEWALGAMLLAGKNLATTVTDAACRRWAPHQSDILLRGRTVMVLGLGDIGRYLAGACSALGMKVVGVSRSGRPVSGVEHVISRLGPWKNLLGEVSFLVNCLPLTPETENLVDLSVLDGLASPAYLINVGRGETVVEADIVASVGSGSLRGAILDTVRQEPLPPESRLWNCPEIVISPHSSSFTDATESRTRALFVDQIERHTLGLTLLNQIDTERGY